MAVRSFERYKIELEVGVKFDVPNVFLCKQCVTVKKVLTKFFVHIFCCLWPKIFWVVFYSVLNVLKALKQ